MYLNASLIGLTWLLRAPITATLRDTVSVCRTVEVSKIEHWCHHPAMASNSPRLSSSSSSSPSFLMTEDNWDKICLPVTNVVWKDAPFFCSTLRSLSVCLSRALFLPPLLSLGRSCILKRGLLCCASERFHHQLGDRNLNAKGATEI